MNAKAKTLLGNILPALGGLFVTYLYNVVDGIFVGRGVGASALGAVNIAVPFITFVVALTAMFPMGGATIVAIRMGRGDKEGANHAFMTAFSLTLLMSALLMMGGMVFSQQIVDFSGAKGLSMDMRRMAAQYLFYYPHAGNDVFYVRGLYHGRQINAYIKAARQRGADVGNEISILSQLRSPVAPPVVDFCLDGTPFIVTQALSGERLSTIVGENSALESLLYLEEYGAALARIHQLNIQAERVKDRKFFHAPPNAVLEALEFENLKGLFPSAEEPANTCFCHGDFHYANILWAEHQISGILDFELAGYGNKEFDIAWSLFRRPGQKFLRTEAELQTFLNGYRQFGTCDAEAVKTYMAQCYVYFLQFCSDNAEYCAYARAWLQAFANEKRGRRTD